MTGNELISRAYEVIVQPILWVLFAVAFLIFFWGIVEFIRGAGSDEGRSRGRRHILWGVIGLFIMASVFGITQVIIDSLGLTGEEGKIDGPPPLQGERGR